MKAATDAAPMLQDLPLSAIRPSATNPRRTIDQAALAELAASIREHGIRTPLLVRPMPASSGAVDWDESEEFFEIVAGHRRFQAAQALQLETAPCIIRAMEDDEAREIAIIDNLQRADVHPLEEAEAFDELLGSLGSVAAVAAKLGKEQAYVAKQLRLVKLTVWSRDALRGGLIAIEHALLLARLAETEQDAALKWCLDRAAGSKESVDKVVARRLAGRAKYEKHRGENPGMYMTSPLEPESPLRLKAWIEAESGILLERAPWATAEDDGLLADVGACSECPKNSKANVPLFGDLEMGAATCTDGACFAAKTAAFVQIEMRVAGHEPAGPNKQLVPQLSWKYSGVKPSVIPNGYGSAVGIASMTANPAKVLKQGQWVAAKKGSCGNVRAGVTMDWSDDGQRGYMGDGKKLRKPGEVLQVCLAVGCKVHPKDWEKPKAKGEQAERRDPEAEKRAEAEREHCVKVEMQIRSTLLHAILLKLDAAKAIHLVADERNGAAAWRKKLLGIMPELDGATLAAFVVFCESFSWSFRVNGWTLMREKGVADDRKKMFALAKAAGVDGPKVVAEYFHEQGSIAPASERLYPKGIPWPKGAKAGPPAAPRNDKKKTAAKKAAAKPVAKKAAGKLSAEARKKIADNMKKRWAESRKKAARKTAAKKVVRK